LTTVTWLAKPLAVWTYPFWAIILIAMHIIVIMALTVHGDVVKPK
jgi:hypothetical protein